MEKSESIKELAAALSVAQGQMPAVPMGSVNPFLKNKYANLGDVIKTAQPILAKNGLSYSQAVYAEGPTIGVETILMHSSGEWMMSRMAIHPGDDKGISSAQSAGKTITYLRRYTLSAVLGVYADEDADGNVQAFAQNPRMTQPVKQPAPEQTVDEAFPPIVDEAAYNDACEVMTGDGKVRYGDRPTEDLARVINNKKSPPEKVQAAKTIIAWRNAHP